MQARTDPVHAGLERMTRGAFGELLLTARGITFSICRPANNGGCECDDELTCAHSSDVMPAPAGRDS
jgi:hypothetical protein